MIDRGRQGLRVADLSVTFARNDDVITAVSHVSIAFEPGTRVAIVGETGSGKSILASAILRLLPPGATVTGSVQLGDEALLDASKARMREIRRRTAALVPQSPAESLNPMMDVRKQLAEGVAHDGRRDNHVAAAPRVDAALSTIGFPDRGDPTHRFAYQLSGGLAQRAVVAGALARRPRWIIADEPTKGLDASLRLRCVQAIQRACDETESGLIVITHDLDVARNLAERIVLLYAGDVVEDARADRFFEATAHPYARGLLSALPDRGLHPIPGDPPAAGGSIRGCRFAPRCSHAHAECTGSYPESRVIGPAHSVRCVLHSAVVTEATHD